MMSYALHETSQLFHVFHGWLCLEAAVHVDAGE